jgi:eukaryotic-like serine/threonine-protein kinase
MGLCARCGKRWSADHRVCPDDGMVLVADAKQRTTDGALAIDDRSEDELAPGTIAGDYRIERKLGEGAMGAVYGARHTLIGKRAAIKVIRSELSASRNAVDRFVLEAQAVNQIGHPNIVDVFGFGALDDGRSFFVMEWLEGETLRVRLTRPVAYLEALELVETVAKALQAAHEAGVMHRDLKPDNVYLANVKDDRPAVKLLDFGLAKLSGTVEPRIERTRTGVVLGTPLYISPEQAKGTRIDSATDVYSLGAIAYEMFTGHVPFMADSAIEIMSLHITTRPRPPRLLAPGIPHELEALIMAMLEKDPARRPTAAQVRGELSAMRKRSSAPVLAAPASFIQSSPPVATLPISRTPVPSTSAANTQRDHGPRPNRRRLGIVAAAIAIAAAAGVTTYLVARPSAGEPEPATPVASAAMQIDAAIANDAARVVIEVDAGTVTPPPPTPPTPVIAAKLAVPRTGKVLVRIVGVDHAKIVVDGHLAAARSSGTSLDLATGDHEIDVRSAGHLPEIRHVHVVAGTKQEVDVTPAVDPNAVHNPYGDD